MFFLYFNKYEELNGIERFSNDCRKANTKVITTTNHSRSTQRHEPIRSPSKLDITFSARGKKLHVQGAIGFGFASHWLKIWRNSKWTPL